MTTSPNQDPPNLDLIIKLMKMTGSSFDAEALVALRKADVEVAKAGGWEKLLRGRITIVGNPFAGAAPVPRYEAKAPPPPPAPMRPTPQPAPRPYAPPPRTASPVPPTQQARPTTPPPKVPKKLDDQINKYPGDCHGCRQQVRAHAGMIRQNRNKINPVTGEYKWELYCHACHSTGAKSTGGIKPTLADLGL